MRNYKSVYVTIVAFLMLALPLSAKNEMQSVYLFGFAASFNDSTVYFTSVQRVDSAWVNTKTKFLLSRENYSSQLANYLSGKGEGNRVCVVSFAKDEKAATKKLEKMVARYSKAAKSKKKKQKDSNLQANSEEQSPYIIKFIDGDDFAFMAVKPYEVEMEENSKAEKAEAEKAKKEKKKGNTPPPMGNPPAGDVPPMRR